MSSSESPENSSSIPPLPHISSPTPVPYKKLAGAYVLLFCEAISITSFFSYIGYMILHFGVTDDINKVGYYAGFVASSFSLSQFFSSYFWGKMSDRFGRKPILLYGSIGSMLSSFGVGLSGSLPLLIIMRSVNGLLNGNTGVVKTYIGEITDKSNQVICFSYVGLTWGLGSIIGPILGGLLSEPNKHIGIFKNSALFAKYPYLLPNIVIGTITAIGVLFTFFFMKETLKKEPKSNSIEMESLTNDIPDEEETLGNPKIIVLDSNEYHIQDDSNKLETIDGEKEVLTTNNSTSPTVDGADYLVENNMGLTLDDNSTNNKKESSDFQEISLLESNSGISRPNILKKSFQTIYKKLFKKSNNKSYFQLDEDESSINRSGNDKKEETTKEMVDPRYETNVFKNKLVISTTILYTIVGFIFTMYDEGFPIWAMAPLVVGGLGFSTKEIGISGAIGGSLVVVIQVVIVKKFTNAFGLIKTFRYGCILTMASFITIPLLNLVSPFQGRPSENSSSTSTDSDHSYSEPPMKSILLFWTIISISLIFRGLAGQLIFTPVMTLINNSTTSKTKGSANGLAQSTVALSRAFAPTIASTAVAWSLSGHPFPFNHYFIFVLITLFTVGPLIHSYFLPDSLNEPMIEDRSLLHQEEEETYSPSSIMIE
eukprot:gene3810-4740_t